MEHQRRIGRYQVLEEIASGGQATVFRAWDTTTGQVVALKVMHPHLIGDAAYLERFRREAGLASSISHPNVIRLFEVGQDGDSHYISMEYLALSLHDLIQAQGQLPIERAADICRQTALALEAADKGGIVHRDIKPQNIMLAPDGTAKVSDFGIARAVQLSTMTRTGALMGTPHYMAPEQAQGQRANVRSDIYSLGVVLYQMLTGKVPFDAETPWDVIRQHIETQPQEIRKLRADAPKALGRLVDRCLEKDPKRRFQTPQELVSALDDAVPQISRPQPQRQPMPSVRQAPREKPPRPAQRQEIRAEPSGPAPRKGGSRMRTFRRIIAAAAMIAVVGAIAAIALQDALSPRPPVEPKPEPTVHVVKAVLPAAKERPIVNQAPGQAVVEKPVVGKVNREVVVEKEIERPAPAESAVFVSSPPGTDGASGSVVLVSDSSWKVSDEQQPGWNEVGFDDGSWMNSEAPWQFWDHDDLAPAQAMWHPGAHDDDFAWYFFRKSFTIPSAAALTRAELTIQVDDDYVLYLNGQEVARDESGVTDSISTFDVLPSLGDGENLIAIMAIDSFGGNEGVNVKLHVDPMTAMIVSVDPTEDSRPLVEVSGILVKAYVDGRSLLMISGSSVQWLHLEAAAPGRLDGVAIDTYVGDQAWAPQWPDTPDAENRDCRCYSSSFEAPQPLLPMDDIGIGLEVLQSRAGVSILEQPSDRNGFTAVIEFDDNGPGGADWYEVLIVPSFEAAASTSPGMTKGATISGRVTDADSGIPISNLYIEAENVRDGGPNFGADTNGDGRYLLDGVAPGSYRIRAESSERGYIEEYYDDQPSWDDASLVTIVGSKAIEGIDFGLKQGATISGRVTDASTGLPLDDVAISADEVNSDYRSHVHTEADGKYILRGLAPGAYRVSAGGEGRDYIEEMYDDRLRWDDADLVVVEEKQSVAGIDFSLSRGATISGRVTDAETGRPLSRVNIEACNVGDDGPGSYSETDADGRYVLQGVAPGSYRIEAETRNQEGYIREYHADQLNWDDANFLTVVGSETIEGIDFALKMGATVSGRVIDAATGLPIVDIEIIADSVSRESNSNTRTSADGRYTLRGLAPGAYRIQARGYEQGYIEEMYDDRLSWDDADLVFVEERESVTAIDFSLSRGTTISGKVTDASTGLPLAKIKLRARNIKDGYPEFDIRTGPDGRYQLTGIAPGIYRIWVRGDTRDYVREYYNDKLGWDDADLVSVVGTRPVQGIDFALEKGGTISGRLIDVDTGLPIGDIHVEAQPDGWDGMGSYGRTDADGRYTLRGLASGAYRILARAQEKGYIEVYYDQKLRGDDPDLITVSGRESIEGIDLLMKLGAAISGRVLDGSTGLPIADMDVRAGPIGGDHLSWSNTNSEGRYVLTGIPDGLIEVEVGGRGYIEVRRIATVRDGQDVTDFDF